MRFHAPLCVLPPCASSLLWAGRIRGLTLSPVSLCSLPASSCMHLDRPHGLFFRLSSPPDADGHSSFYPAASALCPRPASIRLPATGLLCRAIRPLWRSGATNGHQVAPGHHMPNRKWPSSALFTRPPPAGRTHAHSGALPLRVEPPGRLPPHNTKRKESRGFPSSCQRGGHRASQILS